MVASETKRTIGKEKEYKRGACKASKDKPVIPGPQMVSVSVVAVALLGAIKRIKGTRVKQWPNGSVERKGDFPHLRFDAKMRN